MNENSRETPDHSLTIRLTPVRSSRFKRDVKRAEGRGKDPTKLGALLESLIRGEPLSALHRDHLLRGKWNGYREVHIEPDWLLIYRVVGTELRLARTGSHAELFRK